MLLTISFNRLLLYIRLTDNVFNNRCLIIEIPISFTHFSLFNNFSSSSNYKSNNYEHLHQIAIFKIIIGRVLTSLT